jgi:outer membrane protein assembly factor BamE
MGFKYHNGFDGHKPIPAGGDARRPVFVPQSARVPVSQTASNLVNSLSYLARFKAHGPRAFAPFVPAALCVLIAGCAADSSVNKYVPNIVTPYRMDIQQGNFVTQDMVEKLQVGQTRDQVRFILGTPLLADSFHGKRWDYPFRFSKGWNDPQRAHLVVVFGDDDKLACWRATVPLPKSAEAAPEQKGFFSGMFSSNSRSASTGPTTLVSSDSTGAGDATPCGAAIVAAPAGVSPQQVAAQNPAASPAPAPAAAAAAPASAPAAAPPAEPAAPQQPANLPSMSSDAAQASAKAEQQKPSLLRRMFGWLPGVSTEDAAAGAARAASPENTPMPRPTVADPPKPPSVEPAPVAGTVTVEPIRPDAPSGQAPAPAAAGAPAAAPAAPAVPAPAAPAPAPTPAGALSAQPAPIVATATAAPMAAVTPAPAARQDAAPTPDGVLAAVERWRAAWQGKDVTRYLAAYAPDFRTPGNLPRARWEAQRRERLTKPTFIVVKVVDPNVTLGKDDAAVAVFVQEYESNLLKESGRKTLRMARYGNDWLILEEISR